MTHKLWVIIYDVISVTITYFIFLLMCTILNQLHHVVLNIYSINAFSRIFIIETSSMVSLLRFKIGGGTLEGNSRDFSPSWLFAYCTATMVRFKLYSHEIKKVWILKFELSHQNLYQKLFRNRNYEVPWLSKNVQNFQFKVLKL